MARTPAQPQEKEESDEAAPRRSFRNGHLLTWHLHDCRHDCALLSCWQKLQMASRESDEFEALVEEIASLPSVQSVCQKFQGFVDTLYKGSAYTRVSVSVELNLDGEAGLLHGHAAASIKDVASGCLPVNWQQQPHPKDTCFVLQGSGPDIECNQARGRHAVNSVNRMHTYSQCSKLGQVYKHSTYMAPKAFPVEGKWRLSWWRQHKLSSDALLRDCLRYRCSSRAIFEEVSFHTRKSAEMEDQALMRQLTQKLSTTLGAFKRFIPINREGAISPKVVGCLNAIQVLGVGRAQPSWQARAWEVAFWK